MDRQVANFEVYSEGASYLDLPYHARRLERLAVMSIDAAMLLNPHCSTLRICDLGFGGSNLWQLAKRYGASRGIQIETTVADINEQPLRLAKIQGVDNAILLDLDLTPAEQNIHPNSYDIIYLCEVIEHVPTPAILLNKWQRALSPSGIIGITSPNLAPLPERYRFGAKGEGFRHTHPLHRYLYVHISTLTESGLIEMVSATDDLQVVTIGTQLVELPLPLLSEPLQIPISMPNIGGSLIGILASRQLDLDKLVGNKHIAGKQRRVMKVSERYPPSANHHSSKIADIRAAKLLVNLWRSLNPNGHVPYIAVIGDNLADISNLLYKYGARTLNISNASAEDGALGKVRNDVFDGIILGSALETIFDSRSLMKECSQLLSPTGIFLGYLRNLARWQNRIDFLYGYTPDEMRRGQTSEVDKPTIRPWTNNRLIELLTGAELRQLVRTSDVVSARLGRKTGTFSSRNLASTFPGLGDALISVATPKSNQAVKVDKRMPALPHIDYPPINTPPNDFAEFAFTVKAQMPELIAMARQQILTNELSNGYVHVYGYASFPLSKLYSASRSEIGTAMLHVYPAEKPFPRDPRNLTIPTIHSHRGHLFSCNVGPGAAIDHLFHAQPAGFFDSSIPSLGSHIRTKDGDTVVPAKRFIVAADTTGELSQDTDLPIVYLSRQAKLRRAGQGGCMAMPAGMYHATANSSLKRLVVTIAVFSEHTPAKDSALDLTGTFAPGIFQHAPMTDQVLMDIYRQIRPTAENWMSRPSSLYLLPDDRPSLKPGLTLPF